MTGLKDTQQQKKFKVLLIGDSCIDQYIHGSVERLSPEAPVPILKQFRETKNPGMAANVRSNLEALGCDVDFITNSETIVKTRYIDDRTGYNLLRVDQENKIVPWSGNTIYDCNDYDTIVVSDYAKGFLDYHHITNLREKFNGPMFLDTKKTDLSMFHGIFVKINEAEYSRVKSINDNMIVTLGDRGAMLKTGRDPRYEKIFSAPKVEVFDVCGAGDTFLSALTYKYLLTNDITKSITFANKAAAITVQHLGVYAPTLEEIKCV